MGLSSAGSARTTENVHPPGPREPGQHVGRWAGRASPRGNADGRGGRPRALEKRNPAAPERKRERLHIGPLGPFGFEENRGRYFYVITHQEGDVWEDYQSAPFSLSCVAYLTSEGLFCSHQIQSCSPPPKTRFSLQWPSTHLVSLTTKNLWNLYAQELENLKSRVPTI